MNDTPRYMLAKGGEGGGKSVAGIVKTLYKLSRGLSPGVMGSPDFEHFKKSLWPEFRRWCPWDYVIPKQRTRASVSWVPPGPFDMVFDGPRGEVVLTCGGFENPGAWEGPNLNFLYFDEARRHKTPDMLKVADGRVRIPGPNGESPQIFMATTPRKHWLFEYFGPIIEDDPFEKFKRDSFVIDLLTADNAKNLAEGFADLRRQTLTEAEARVLLEAAWEDIDEADRFLSDMLYWDNCREVLPPLREPMVVVADAGIKNDSFGLVGVTRHPQKPEDVAVRFVQEWKPPRGGSIDFDGTDDAPGPLMVIEQLCRDFNVVEFSYDPYQLHYAAKRIRNKSIVVCREFSQGGDRLEADKNLRDLILARRITHDGNAALRAHVDNANAKPDPDTRKLRLVKRHETAKIDLCVALSMAAYRCLKLPL